MRTISFVCICLALFAASCSNKTKEKQVEYNELNYFTDYDGLRGYSSSDNIYNGDAASGNYYSKADSSMPFSAGFQIAIEKISSTKLKKIDVTAKVWRNSDDCDASIVITAQRGDSNVVWMGYTIKDVVKELKKWEQMKISMNLPQNLEKRDILKVYLWNSNGKGEARIDDVSIKFE